MSKTDSQPSIYVPAKADPSEYFSPEQVKKSKDYNRPLKWVGVISIVITLGWLALFIAIEGPKRIIGSLGIDSPWWLQVIVVTSSLVLLAQLFSVPTSLYSTFVHEERWGFNNETPKTWIMDWFKSLIVGMVVVSVLFVPLWAVIRAVEAWWLVGALVLTAFSVIFTALAPVVIMPIFNKFEPVQDEQLRARMKDLASKGGISISDVEVMDASKRTKHNNAFFAGLGKTRKLVIYDNMLEFDRELIDVVVSHEIGHWRHGHLRKAIALGTLTTFVEFYVLDLLLGTKAIMDWAGVDSIGNPAAIPLFLGGFGLIATLVGLIDSWVSRVHERQADLFALELTEDPDSYIKVWKEFTEKDLAELTPSWWKKISGSHPPIADRIAFAMLWQDARGGRKAQSALKLDSPSEDR